MFKLTTISVILFVTTIINFLAAYISWRRRKTRGGLYFALGTMGVTLWTLAAGFDYASIPISLKVFFAKFEYTGYNLAFASFAMFVMTYAGFETWLGKPWVKSLFLFIPASNILLAWTNDWHGWLWSGFVRSDIGDNMVIFEHGSGYLWAIITGYLMILIIIVPLWHASRRGSELSRRQARLLFGASLLTVVGNVLYLLETPSFRGVDWTPLSFSISSLLFVWALYGTRLLDLVPIARDKLVKNLSDGMIVLDRQNRIIDINQTAAQMFELQTVTLIGKDLANIIPQSRLLWDQALEQEIKTGFEVGVQNKRYFDVLLSPLREGSKGIIGRLIIFRDITERKEAEIQLRNAYDQLEEKVKQVEELQIILHEQAIRDSLTGLHNRHYLKEVLGGELARAKREGYPVCFVLIDIDHFKSINDKYGHSTGDIVLQHFANQLLQLTRTGDIVCRYGGEEFLVILPNTMVAMAAQIAERWRITFEALRMIVSDRKIGVTISCGVSEFPAHSSTETEALEIADKALYTAKNSGRNQVVIWSENKDN